MKRRIPSVQQWCIVHIAAQIKKIFSRALILVPVAILLAVLTTSVLQVPDARAAVFDVYDTGDAGDVFPGDGICDSDAVTSGQQCTLRAAIEEANALAGPDAINLTVPGPFNLSGGELTAASEIILNGNGATISAGNLSRVFLVESGGNLSLDNVTIQEGNADAGGGLLINWGGLLNISNSAIISNTATTNGGGINNFFGTLHIINSTISGNRANDGGGLIHFSFDSVTVTLTHVTISKNHADTRGGGISAFGRIRLENSVVAGNSTGDGGPDCDDDPVTPFITTEQYNLIGDNTGCAGTFPAGIPNANNDFVGTSGSPLDPLLADLTGNPAYHPLLAGSPAIDQIPLANCTVDRDQPGTTRPQGPACDIGAIENSPVVSTDLEIIKSVVPTTPVTPGETITYTLSFRNIGSGIATDVTITDVVPDILTNVIVTSSGAAIIDSGVTPSFIWNVEDLSQNESGIININGQISPNLTEDTTVVNTATISASAVDSDPNNNRSEVSTTVSLEELGWRDICVPQRMEMTGVGIGDGQHTLNPQTLSLADPDSVRWLLAQMAGRLGLNAPTPREVTFTTTAPQVLTLNEPSKSSAYGYTFEANLQPTGQITGSVDNPGNSYKTPRGVILYSKRTMTDAWTSVGKTTNNFVYRSLAGRSTHTEAVTFPPLAESTDLFVTAAVIDNDADSRSMIIEAEAGGVSGSVTELGPTDGAGLNLVNLMLPQVPAGTSQASVTLRSPSGTGDSLVLVGLNVSFPCTKSAEALLHVVPNPVTVPLAATDFVTITVDPGSTAVNGVQIHGQVDPTYLRLVDVLPTGILPTELDPVAFDPSTGMFRYGAGLVDDVIAEPFPVLVLEVQAVATTTGTQVEFLDEFPPTDISGLSGSVMRAAQPGLVIVTANPTLRGAVDMQGRPSKPAPPWAIPLTVWLTPAGGSAPTQHFDTTTDQNGEFSLDLVGLSPGLYDIQVKGNHTLRNLAPGVSLASGDNHNFFDTLLEGDVETVATFNQVRQPDADVLIGSFNICLGQPGFMANADLDESGCVSLSDFGLLSGNFGQKGDLVVVSPGSLSPASLRASNGGALLTFDIEDMMAAVDEAVTLTLNIDPRDQPVNGGMVQLSFDPNLVEVEDITLTDDLPVVLIAPTADNQQGLIRFAAGILGQTITEKFPMATLSLKLKEPTTGTTITPVDLFTATDVSGPQGSVLADATGITLRSEAQEQLFFPIIMK